MKKIFAYLAALVFAAVAVSCVDEQALQDPELNLSATQVEIGAEGGKFKIVYELSGVSDGVSLEVINDAGWLEVSTARARIIEVSAQKNDTGEERTAQFTVRCKGVEDVSVSVVQKAWQDPITLTVLGTEATKVIFSVKTLSDDFTWVGQVVGKELKCLLFFYL